MATGFEETLRAVRGERRSASSWALALLLGVLAAWVAWGCLARVRVFEVSTRARIERAEPAYQLTARRAGRLSHADARLGQRIEAGHRLFAFDRRELVARSSRLKAELEAMPARERAIVVERDAWQSVVHARRELSKAERGQAHTRRRTAKALAGHSRDELRELQALVDQGSLAPAELRAIRRELARVGGELELARRDVDVHQGREQVAIREVEAKRATLDQGLLALQRERTRIEAELRVLELELKSTEILAPRAGTIGTRAPIAEGAWVERGQELATLMPDGRLRCVANFAPERAAGKIREGQSAVLRFDGFSWTRYGTVSAVVDRVSQPTKRETLRVELLLDASADDFPVEITHGMTAAVEIEVERATPLQLLTRAAGLALSGVSP